MFNLPIELQRLIFEFDTTFRYIQWGKVTAQIKRNGKNYPHYFDGVNVYLERKKYHYIPSKSYGYNSWINNIVSGYPTLYTITDIVFFNKTRRSILEYTDGYDARFPYIYTC